MKKYKIRLNPANPAEMKRIFDLLFYCGYVFTRERRFKTYKQVYDCFCARMSDWAWIITGYDEDCQRVIGAMVNQSYYQQHTLGSSDNYETVTIEQFLSRNGHLR